MSSTPTPEKILVVADPTDTAHVALQRALITAGQRADKPQLQVFLAVDGDAVATAADNDLLFRDLPWLQAQILAPLQAAGVESAVEMCWSTEWQWAIQRSASRSGAGIIYLPLHTGAAHRGGRHLSISGARWDLLKTATCPVLLVRPGASSARRVVLAPVNMQVQREHQDALNQRIIGRGRLVAERNGAEFHVVNACLDSMHCPPRDQLAHALGVPAAHVHVRQGYTDVVVAAVARDIQADLVIIGTLGQRGKDRGARGSTATRVIAAVDVDVMVFNHLTVT